MLISRRMAEKGLAKAKKAAKKAWHFIWESNSPLSWAVNIILAFVIIKFMVYPGLGFALGTTHPVVAVISGSMEHNSGFDDWWEAESCCTSSGCDEKSSQEELYIPYLITKMEFREFGFRNGFNKGDIMVLKSPKNIEVGDVIVFNVAQRADPIIHRVVEIKDGKYFTKGDNNCGSAEFEKGIMPEKVLGKAFFRLPFLGWIKIGFVGLLRIAGIGA